MAKLSLPSPAKINLFLNIVGRRPDGYHRLQTVFQLLDFGDTLTLHADGEAIAVDCPGLAIDPRDNLVIRAAYALRQRTGHRGGVHVRVEKRIPVGAGLGGGSSNAATTLLGLNRLWNLGLRQAELLEIAGTLGADVPVFVAGHSAWAEGIGDELQPIDLPKKSYVLLMPGCRVNTADIFNHPDLTRHGSPITIARFLSGGAVNVCEPLVRRLYPAVDEAVRWLGQWGAARMTGTGSCVFLGLESRTKAEEIASMAPAAWSAVVADGVNTSPLHAALGS